MFVTFRPLFLGFSVFLSSVFLGLVVCFFGLRSARLSFVGRLVFRSVFGQPPVRALGFLSFLLFFSPAPSGLVSFFLLSARVFGLGFFFSFSPFTPSGFSFGVSFISRPFSFLCFCFFLFFALGRAFYRKPWFALCLSLAFYRKPRLRGVRFHNAS